MARHNLFEALIAMEPEIKQALDSELDKQRVVSVRRFASSMSDSLAQFNLDGKARGCLG